MSVLMHDLNLFCEKCRSDKFEVNVATPFSYVVNSITCKNCGSSVEPDEVVVFTEENRISEFNEYPFNSDNISNISRDYFEHPANDIPD